MDDDERSIELEIEVVGTPEEVWQAIATGPGISSWYVPHTVEEREGGAAVASFGPGPEMQIRRTGCGVGATPAEWSSMAAKARAGSPSSGWSKLATVAHASFGS